MVIQTEAPDVSTEAVRAILTRLGAQLPAAVVEAPQATSERIALRRFKDLMALEGWPVQLARMIGDRTYAYERIAQAYCSASAELRRLALELFEQYREHDERVRR